MVFILVELSLTLSSSVGICKEIYLITIGLTEANVATVLAGWLCYVRIPKESGRCRERKVGGSEVRPDVAGNGRSEGQKRVRPIAIDYRTVAGTAGAGYKGDRRSKGPDSRSPGRTPTALWRHKGGETSRWDEKDRDRQKLAM